MRSVYPFRYEQENFEERAAIIEYCGNIPKEQAEHLAEEQCDDTLKPRVYFSSV